MKRLLLALIFLVGFDAELSVQTSSVFVNFENGIIPVPQESWPDVASTAAVPRAILTESGNHFLRLVASPTDCGPLFATTCPRTRALVGPGWSTVTSGQTITYAWRMRLPGGAANPAGTNGMVMQLFQDGTAACPTCARTIWIGNKSGHLWLVNSYI